MKTFLTLSVILILLYLIGYINRSGTHVEWMSRDYTNALKGFAILTVLWAHTGAWSGVEGIQFIAGIGVALFLLCSGYGLQIAFEKTGLKGFWKKRLFRVAIPFWLVETIGLLVTGQWDFKIWALDALLFRPATAFGWYIQFIAICYILFYFVQLAVMKRTFGETTALNEKLLYGIFLLWFLIDSLFLANPMMPFLRARQMLSFPLGVSIARHRKQAEAFFIKPGVFLISFVNGTMFMAVTQLRPVKESPYLIQNLLSLCTVLPLAVALISTTDRWRRLADNSTLKALGLISYEVYLVHVFTLGLLQGTLWSAIIFVGITLIGAWSLHMIFERFIKHG